MNFWITLWTAIFFISIALFAGMAVWVAIGGWKDLIDMLRQLKEDRDAAAGTEDP